MKRLLLLATLAALIWWIGSEAGEYLQPVFYQELYRAEPLLTAGIFFLSYVVMAALSIPGAAIMTLLAGAIFGLWAGALLVSFASSIGATLAFLVSRTLLRDWVEKRFDKSVEKINKGVEKDGNFYLFTLRMIPAVPFFVINLVMGLTRMKVWSFYWVSQIGMLAATLVYVNAGARIGQIEELSVAGILTPSLLGGFVLLGLFPYLARAIIQTLQKRKVYRPWRHLKPRSFDANLVVIGAGSAGLVSAYIAAAVKAKVILIEKHRMGGDCLNTGCVPSKALLKSASVAHLMTRAEEFGLSPVQSSAHCTQVMARVQNVIRQIEPHDSIDRYTRLGVEVVEGEAEIISPWVVRVGDRLIRTKQIILAMGASPFVPDIAGLDRMAYLTTDTVWGLTELPRRLLVLGSGPVGCELAQAFQRLGSEVTMVFRSKRLLPKEDEDVATELTARFIHEGMHVFNESHVLSFSIANGEKCARLKNAQGEFDISFDQVLVATGRQARLSVPGLETLALEVNPNGTLVVDDYLRTRFPNILACGDLVGPYQYTHAASHQAWYAAVNALFSPFKQFKVDYRVLPKVTFTDPEIARVGLSEAEASAQKIAYEVTGYGIDDLDRAIADGEAHGFVKVLTAPNSDKILGATIVGYQSGNVIGEFVLAMKYGIGLNKILGTVHAYPTFIEANKYAAGVWKKNHVPQGVLKWVERFHRWRRNG